LKTKHENDVKGGRKKSAKKAKASKENSIFNGDDKDFMKKLEKHLNSALDEIDDFTEIEIGDKNLVSVIKKATSELDKKHPITVETVKWGGGKIFKEANTDMKTSVKALGLWTCQAKKAVFTGNNSHNPNFPVKRRAQAEIQVIIYVLQNKKVLDHIVQNKEVEKAKAKAREKFVMALLKEVVERA